MILLFRVNLNNLNYDLFFSFFQYQFNCSCILQTGCPALCVSVCALCAPPGAKLSVTWHYLRRNCPEYNHYMQEQACAVGARLYCSCALCRGRCYPVILTKQTHVSSLGLLYCDSACRWAPSVTPRGDSSVTGTWLMCPCWRYTKTISECTHIIIGHCDSWCFVFMCARMFYGIKWI